MTAFCFRSVLVRKKYLSAVFFSFTFCVRKLGRDVGRPLVVTVDREGLKTDISIMAKEGSDIKSVSIMPVDLTNHVVVLILLGRFDMQGGFFTETNQQPEDSGKTHGNLLKTRVGKFGQKHV